MPGRKFSAAQRNGSDSTCCETCLGVAGLHERIDTAILSGGVAFTQREPNKKKEPPSISPEQRVRIKPIELWIRWMTRTLDCWTKIVAGIAKQSEAGQIAMREIEKHRQSGHRRGCVVGTPANTEQKPTQSQNMSGSLCGQLQSSGGINRPPRWQKENMVSLIGGAERRGVRGPENGVRGAKARSSLMAL
ncbi:hypothetical protein B0H19DRAFT_1083529 [Mycena capillaripes]|nr:hypothetical protein B0H19DRAFT_1083529 [Mycena capillaripes]